MPPSGPNGSNRLGGDWLAGSTKMLGVMAGKTSIALVLGAGASWASPAGRPLFGPIADALFGAVGVAVARDRRWLMAPEALLSRLADRGVDVEHELRQALAGGQPNALHYAAAAVLDRGRSVWTTNFDELIETAAAQLGVSFHRVLYDGDPECGCKFGHIFKPHGTLSGSRLVARSEQVLRPLPAPWLLRLRRDFEGADVALVGYAGADVDLRSGLRAALDETRSATWYARSDDEQILMGRFFAPIQNRRLALRFSDRPDIGFLSWAEANGLNKRTPADITQATRGPLPPAPVRVSFVTDRLLGALIADDFGDYKRARHGYRQAVFLGPHRTAAARFLLSTGLIHGAPWRPPVVAALRLASLCFARQVWPAQQLLLYLTWNGHTAQAWRVARRAIHGTDDTGLRLQAANVAKETEPPAAVDLAVAAQEAALTSGDARRAAWATLCLSLALRWTGDLDRASLEATRLADGFDALAGPVWRAWGHFELGAVAALRGDAGTGVTQMRLAREVFTAAGAETFIFDALCGEIATERIRDLDAARGLLGTARKMLDNGTRTSRFAREVVTVEEGEVARAQGRLTDAERAFRNLAHSPTVAQRVLGLLGHGEVQRARGEPPTAAKAALERSRSLGFGFGIVHAAITLGLAGTIAETEAEAIITGGPFPAPERPDRTGLLRLCIGLSPEQHPIIFP